MVKHIREYRFDGTGADDRREGPSYVMFRPVTSYSIAYLIFNVTYPPAEFVYIDTDDCDLNHVCIWISRQLLDVELSHIISYRPLDQSWMFKVGKPDNYS